jgi:uncharacterized membrane protein YdjX (TVP38/TMEM64 family)
MTQASSAARPPRRGKIPHRIRFKNWFGNFAKSFGKQGLKKTAVLLLILAALFTLQRYLPLQAWLKEGAETYRALGNLGILLFVVTYALLALVFVPGPMLSITAGALYGTLLGFGVTLAGAALTSCLCFVLARFLMHDRALGWVSRYTTFTAIHNACRRHGTPVATLVHMSPVLPMSIANYMLSLTPLRFSRYLAASLFGMAPGILFYVYGGTLGDALALKGQGLNPVSWWILMGGRIGLWITGFSATAVLAWFIRKQAKARHAATEPAPEISGIPDFEEAAGLKP